MSEIAKGLQKEYDNFVNSNDFDTIIEEAMEEYRNNPNNGYSHMLPDELFDIRIEYFDGRFGKENLNCAYFQFDSHKKWFRNIIGKDPNFTIDDVYNTFELIAKSFSEELLSRKIFNTYTIKESDCNIIAIFKEKQD